MPNSTENGSAVRNGVIAAVIAVVIWLAITISTDSTRQFEIVGALIVGLIAAAIGVGISIYFDTRRNTT